jgi:hypothetical protein
MVFTEDNVIEIISKQSKSFERKFNNSLWNIDKMSLKEIKEWNKNNLNMIMNENLKTLWIVEIEELDKEKLTLIVDSKERKIVNTKTEKFNEDLDNEENDNEDNEENNED